MVCAQVKLGRLNEARAAAAEIERRVHELNESQLESIAVAFSQVKSTNTSWTGLPLFAAIGAQVGVNKTRLRRNRHTVSVAL